MYMSDIDFSEWLFAQLRSRNLNQMQFARKAKISHPQVSRVLSGIYKPGIEFLNRTSVALQIPLESVYKAAGLLPEAEKKDDSIYVQELRSIAGKLVRDADIKELVYLARIKLENQEKEEEEKGKRKK